MDWIDYDAHVRWLRRLPGLLEDQMFVDVQLARGFLVDYMRCHARSEEVQQVCDRSFRGHLGPCSALRAPALHLCPRPMEPRGGAGSYRLGHASGVGVCYREINAAVSRWCVGPDPGYVAPSVIIAGAVSMLWVRQAGICRPLSALGAVCRLWIPRFLLAGCWPSLNARGVEDVGGWPRNVVSQASRPVHTSLNR